MPNLIVFV